MRNQRYFESPERRRRMGGQRAQSRNEIMMMPRKQNEKEREKHTRDDAVEGGENAF
jgi:hypothetical protein